MQKTVERIIPENFSSKEEYLIYLRHIFAYETASSYIKEKMHILEAGFGEGYGSNFLSNYAAKVIALDVDKDSVLYAQNKYGADNCQFHLYDGKKIPHESNSFDLAISFQVIEHVEKDLEYIKEIHRVLKPEGVLILTTPNRVYRLKPGQKPWNRFHVREYHPQELDNLLKTQFNSVNVWGISGTEELQEIEKNRVRKNFDIVKLDPFKLRKIIPSSIKKIVSKTMRKFVSVKEENMNKDYLNQYKSSDFHVTKTKVEDSLDLFAVCTK